MEDITDIICKVITSVTSRVIILHFFSFRKLVTWIWYRVDSVHGLKLTSRVISSRLLAWILGSHRLPGSGADIPMFLNCQKYFSRALMTTWLRQILTCLYTRGGSFHQRVIAVCKTDHQSPVRNIVPPFRKNTHLLIRSQTPNWVFLDE